jgi:hypothetical protein
MNLQFKYQIAWNRAVLSKIGLRSRSKIYLLLSPFIGSYSQFSTDQSIPWGS